MKLGRCIRISDHDSRMVPTSNQWLYTSALFERNRGDYMRKPGLPRLAHKVEAIQRAVAVHAPFGILIASGGASTGRLTSAKAAQHEKSSD